MQAPLTSFDCGRGVDATAEGVGVDVDVDVCLSAARASCLYQQSGSQTRLTVVVVVAVVVRQAGAGQTVVQGGMWAGTGTSTRKQAIFSFRVFSRVTGLIPGPVQARFLQGEEFESNVGGNGTMWSDFWHLPAGQTSPVTQSNHS